MHAKPRPIPVQGDLRNLPGALAGITDIPNWVGWRYIWKIGKNGVGSWTKVPFQAKHPQYYAKNNDPSTWGDYGEALAAFEAGHCDGIGFNLLGTDLAAFDIDNCRDPETGEISPQAMTIVDGANSYTEVTVSGTGLRVIGQGRGAKVHRKQKIAQSSIGVESYRGAERYIVITGNPLPTTAPRLSNIDLQIDAVVTELDGINERRTSKNLHANKCAHGTKALPKKLRKLIEHGVPPDQDLSAAFHNVVCWLSDLGMSAAQIEGHIAGKPIVPARFGNRLSQEIARSLGKAEFKVSDGGASLGARATENASSDESEHRPGEEQEISLDNFYALMTEHKYIFAPSGDVWPAISVNARFGPKSSTWLDQNRHVEQMTWAPGEAEVIEHRLFSNGGLIERPGCRVFNQYRAPNVKSVAGSARRWLDHTSHLYGDGAAHIVEWLAHRVQRPGEKVNHALVLGGKQGIGKDTILEPVKHAVGPWNFNEVSPQQLLGRFNGFLKSVILRVSEARDLGEFDRFAFYDHMKTYTAAPPDVLRIDEKNRQEYSIPNVCGVIITTNHKSDGIYLPADDRRHYVAWSDRDKSEFKEAYWRDLYGWYQAGGIEIVAHHLQNLDLSDFNPKAPPPQTDAFFDIVNASRTPEDAEMADALDALNWPAVVTIDGIKAALPYDDFTSYLSDRRNSRRIPHRFEACGYTQVRNLDADDGLWKLRGRRQAIYGRNTLDRKNLLEEVRRLVRG